VVPNVVGQKLARAKARILRAHCRVGRVTKKVSSMRKKGRVLSQSPKAGRRLPNRSRINLKVGKGPRR